MMLTRIRIACFLIITLTLVVVLISGCTFWVKDINGNTYKTIIPDQRVDRRVHFFLDNFSTNVRNLFSLLRDYRLRRLLTITNSSFQELILNIGENNPTNPADLHTVYKRTEKLVRAIKTERKKERDHVKRNHLGQALHHSENLLSLIEDFNRLVKMMDP